MPGMVLVLSMYLVQHAPLNAGANILHAWFHSEQANLFTFFTYPQETTVKMVMGKYYTDGPIFLKSGVDLIGRWSEDPPYETRLIMHGSPTGTDGIIVADNISGVVVSNANGMGVLAWNLLQMMFTPSASFISSLSGQINEFFFPPTQIVAPVTHVEGSAYAVIDFKIGRFAAEVATCTESMQPDYMICSFLPFLSLSNR